MRYPIEVNIQDSSVVFILILSFLLVYEIFSVRKLKKVGIAWEQGSLYISNFFSEIEVPKSNIAWIKCHRFNKPTYITISFTNRTKFGKTISFIPNSAITDLNPFKEHSVVKELNEWIKN